MSLYVLIGDYSVCVNFRVSWPPIRTLNHSNQSSKVRRTVSIVTKVVASNFTKSH